MGQYVSDNGARFLRMQIIHTDSNTVLGQNDTGFSCDGTASTFRVMFKEPVEILPSVNYIACATLKVKQTQNWCIRPFICQNFHCKYHLPPTSNGKYRILVPCIYSCINACKAYTLTKFYWLLIIFGKIQELLYLSYIFNYYILLSLAKYRNLIGIHGIWNFV